MNTPDRINALSKLGIELQKETPGLSQVIEQAHRKNKWFIPDYVRLSIEGIRTNYLNVSKLEKWMQDSLSVDIETNKTIALIMAGNLPLVGFHDFLSAYLLGFNMQIKLSSKDEVLLPYFIDRLSKHDPTLAERISFVERLDGFDAVIATGSNNSNRYFEYYFRSKPKILRKNRSSVAVLSGNESKAQLEALSDDIFTYFGLGCRNVSKLFLPEGYEARELLNNFEKYKWVDSHTPYKNNYDYNRTLLLLNYTPHHSNDFIMLVENESLASPLASLHFAYYKNDQDLKQQLERHLEELQCVVGKEIDGMTTVPFGRAQSPELWDYADGVDVIEWMKGIGRCLMTGDR